MNSELYQALTGGFTNLDHIKGHVAHHVETGEVRMINGWPHRHSMYSYSKGWIELRRDELYVDGKGFLRRPPKKRLSPVEKMKNEKAKPQSIMLDALTVASKIDGVWFAADLKPIPTVETKDQNPYLYKNGSFTFMKMKVRVPVVDVLVEKLLKLKMENRRWGSESKESLRFDIERKLPYDSRALYAVLVRTMSKREIKQRIPEALR